MKRIHIPEMPPETTLPFYLAVEEWVAKNLPRGEYFFAWQVDPTVICGRHQDIPLEVDLDFARLQNIYVCRRKSGGGAVYADRNNVMFSYITPAEATQTSFDKYTGLICRMLASLGIAAHPTGRNDIAVRDRKVAGNAFLKLPGKSIVHGTMLFDADFDTMGRVLTPSRAKRMSKGVVSVPSRVTTLRAEGLQINCNEFIRYAVDFLCDGGEYYLTENDITEIKEIQKTYSEIKMDEFSTPGHSSCYLDGVGEIAVNIETDSQNMIKSVRLCGDFFPLTDVEKELNVLLVGILYDKDSIEDAIDSIEIEKKIEGLTQEKFKQLLPNI